MKGRTLGSVEEQKLDPSGSDRRALLKGAVAAGIGVAAYSAPIVSSVPVYATHGLSTVTATGGTYCIWFSPNHGELGNAMLTGDWHTDSGGAGAAIPGFTDHKTSPGTSSTLASIPFFVPVTSTSNEVGSPAGTRKMDIAGNPNNSSATPADFTTDGWLGGGVRIRLFDPDCEVEVLGTSCNSKCKADGSNPAPPVKSFASGSSLSSITSVPGGIGTNKFQGDPTRSVYYHSGRLDHDNGGTKRCKLGIWFRVNCET